MYRGTTPTFKFNFNIDLSGLDISKMYITFAQHGAPIFEKSLEDISIDGNVAIIDLTQAETLLLECNAPLSVQARVKVGSKAYATNIVKINPCTILKEGEI